MKPVSALRLNLLRAMYLLILVGLSTSIWPQLLAESGQDTGPNTVVLAFLTAFSLMALVGLRYPLKMLPVLLLELVWKAIWLITFALPMSQQAALDEYGAGTAFACAMGVVLTTLVVPWDYVLAQLVRARGEPWRRSTQ